MPTQAWDEDIQYILILGKPYPNDLYGLSICAYSVLRLEGHQVIGQINKPELQTMSYGDFLESLTCFDGELNSLFLDVYTDQNRQIVLTNTGEQMSMLNIELFNMTGQFLYSTELELESGVTTSLELTTDMPAGIYLVIVSSNGIRETYKSFLY